MSVYGFLAIRIGISFAFAGLLTIFLRRSVSTKGVGTFACFVIVLGALAILKTVAVLWLTH
jgi:hypothetical protein